MTVRRLAETQPDSFAFTPENQDWCKKQIEKYPENRQASAVIPLLWRAQAQHDGWLPKPAIEKVADMLDMNYIRVLEVATFYSMFNLEPVGKHFIQLCGTTPCMLRGAQDIKAVLQERIGAERHVTDDGKFSWLEVECLGACCNAPMVQINDDYYEDLTPENFAKLLDDLEAGNAVKIGSQTGRTTSEPEPGKANTLLDASLYDGSQLGDWKQRFQTEWDAEKAKAEIQEAGADKGDGKAGSEPVKPEPKPAAELKDKAAGTDAAKGAAVPSASVPASGQTTTAAPSRTEGQTDAAAKAGSNIGGQARREASGGAGGKPPPQSSSSAMDKADEESENDKTGSQPVASDEPVDVAADEADVKAKIAALGKSASAEDKANAVGTRPAGLAAARGGVADDLKRVKGIGKVNEGKLNGLGIFHFDQIAAWSRAEIRWVGAFISFTGRIDRENWLDQARVLAAGGETEFSQRVDAGDVASSAGGASRPDKTK